MKILFVANRAWNFRNFRWGLIKHFQSEGNEVLAAAGVDDTVEELEREKVKYIPIKIESRTKNPFKDLLLFIRFMKTYRRYRPDVILHFTIKPNIYGSLAASFLHIPCINNITGLGNVFLKRGLLNRIVIFLYKISVAKAEKVFFQNRDDMALFDRLRIIRKDRCDLLPGSGIDTDYFKPCRLEKAGEGMIFLMAARMIWEKGVKQYIEAAETIRQEYPETIFKLAGELGVDNPSAIPPQMVHDWNSRGVIEYAGYERDIRKLLCQVDCVVLPSYYREGVPRTLLEASSMGKPIITTDTIGCREVVADGENGYLCEKKNSADLAEKIRRFIGLPKAERERMGEKSREVAVLRFDEHIVIEKYHEAVKECAKSEIADINLKIREKQNAG